MGDGARFPAARGCLVFVLLALLVPAVARAEDPPLVREVYVPYAELLKLAAQDPSGIVMSLDEYRAFVAKALANRPPAQAPVEPPPVEAAVTTSIVSGWVDGGVVRFEADIAIHVAASGWVRCDLGPAPPHLGRIEVDGRPGWALLAEDAKGAPRRLSLILRGKGAHRARVSFSLPVAEVEDRQVVSGIVPTSAATRVFVHVPGDVAGESEPPLLITHHVVPPGDGEGASDVPAESTAFEIGLGAQSAFRLSWKARREGGRQPAVVEAAHVFLCSLDDRYPLFLWAASLDVHRKKTSVVDLVPPAGADVLRVTGEHVHSFRLVDVDGARRVRVQLHEPLLGRLELRLHGVLERPQVLAAATDGASRVRFTLETPALADAARNHGVLALRAPSRLRWSDVQPGTLEPVSREDLAWPGDLGRAAPGERLFAFAGGASRMSVEFVEELDALEAHAAHRLRVTEHGATLSSAVRLQARRGRVWEVELVVPDAFAPSSVSELGTDRGLHPVDIETPPPAPGAPRRLRLRFARALEPGAHAVVALESAWQAFSAAGADVLDGTARQLPLPLVAAAARQRVAFGVEIEGSLEASLGDMPGWRALPSGRLGEYGFETSWLVAAVDTELTGAATPAPIALTLSRRTVRGVYEAVVHALALEDRLRVRADVRLSVFGRPIDAIEVALPVPTDAPALVRAAESREWTPDPASGRRRLVFQRPWQGERVLSFEFDAPVESGQPAPIPLVAVFPVETDGVAESAGVFDPLRFVAVASRGGVRVEAAAGAALETVEVDALPEFSPMLSEGRTVATFRVNERAIAAGPAPTLTTTVFQRSRVLLRGISSLELETTLDRSGVSRTSAAFVLRYRGDQHLAVRLGPNAALRSVHVDGEAVRPVRGGEPGVASIPLPPRSYASIRLVWEQNLGALGALGSWVERGPRFAGEAEEIPVSSVQWTIYRPAGLRVRLDGAAIDSLGGRPIETFASTFWGRLLRLRAPRWTTWEDLRYESTTVALASTASGQQSAEPSQGGVPQLQAQQLEMPVAQADLPGHALVHEGVRTVLTKLGAAPDVTLEYVAPTLERTLKRGVFFAAIAAGLVLVRRRRGDLLLAYVVFGLALATFLPPLLRWESTLLLLPFGEGITALLAALVASAFGWLVLGAWRRVKRALPSSGELRLRLGRRSVGAVVLVASAVLASGALHAQSMRPALPPGTSPDQPVLVPYSLDDFEVPDAPEKRQVYIPYAKFVELWNLAHPDKRIGEEEPIPLDLSVGNAAYSLASDGETYRITGTIRLRVFTREWTSLPLHFGGAQLSRVTLDGRDTGVSYRNGVPFVAIQGAGERELGVVVEGAVRRGLGEATIAAELLAGSATRLEATLPADVELDATAGPSGAPLRLTSSDGAGDANQATRATADLGHDARLVLRWRSRAIRAERQPVVMSMAASLFALEREGYRVTRHEKVRLVGTTVSHLTFTLAGSWSVLDVRGRDVGEWVMHPSESGTGTELEVFFTRRGDAFDLVVEGFAPCGEAPVSPAGLHLVGATREEGFIGLKHHALRRFPLEVLTGLSRETPADFVEAFVGAGASGPQPLDGADRIFHYHGRHDAERVRAVPAAFEGSVDAQLVGLVTSERLAVAARVRYETVAAPGPLAYRVALPDGWTAVSVRGAGVVDWDVRTIAGVRLLDVRFAARVASGAMLEWYAEGPAADAATLAAGVRFPEFRVEGPLRQTSRWALAAADELDLSEGASTNLQPLPLESAPRWLELDPAVSYRMAYRSQQAGAVLELTATPRTSLVRVTDVSLVRVSETHVDVKARIRFTVERRGASRFRVRLPAGAQNVIVDLPNQLARQDAADATGLVLSLTLPSPALGDIELDLSYRLERDDALTVRSPGLQVLDVDSARSFVALVENPLHVLSPGASVGLELVRSADVPQHPELAAASQAFEIARAFQVIARPWALVLREERAEAIAGFDALLELAEIDTVLAADGSSWTTATYTIHNRTRQFIEIETPAEASIWRVLVNGRPVRVSRTAAAAAVPSILVPIERMTETDLSVKVTVTYTLPPIDLPAAWQSFEPSALRVKLDGLQSFETMWVVHVPQGYTLSSTDGNLREVIGQVYHGERVRNIMGQIDRIERRVEQQAEGKLALTRREAQRARQNLIQLQQSLGDAVQDLQQPEGAQLAAGQTIDADEVREQQAQSRQYVFEGMKRYQELSEKTKAAPERQGVTPGVDQSFDGAKRFFESRWAVGGAGRAPQARRDGATLESFRETLGPVNVPPLSQAAADGGRGDAPADEAPAAVLGSISQGLQSRLRFEETGVDVTMPEGGQRFTFRGKVSAPRLEIGLVAHDLAGRVWHGIAFAASVALFALWLRSRRDRVA